MITFQDFEKLKQAVNDRAEWELLYEEQDIRMWKKITGEGATSSSKRYKYTGVLPFKAEIAYSTIIDGKDTKLWDDRHEDSKVLEVVKEKEAPTVEIVWAAKKAPWPAKNRDMVTYTAHKYEKLEGDIDRFMMLGYSGEHPNCPVTDNYCRATVHYFGMIFQQSKKNPNECIYWVVTEMELGGWVPNQLINMVVNKVPADFEKGITKGCQMWADKGRSKSERMFDLLNNYERKNEGTSSD